MGLGRVPSVAANITTRHDEPYDGNGQTNLQEERGTKKLMSGWGGSVNKIQTGNFYRPLTWYLQQSKSKKRYLRHTKQ